MDHKKQQLSIYYFYSHLMRNEMKFIFENLITEEEEIMEYFNEFYNNSFVKVISLAF